jgi:lipopolysaccharide transport system ATP-binding protein
MNGSSAGAAIVAEGLSKVYRIGIRGREDDSFAKHAWNYVRSPLSNYRKYRSLYDFRDVLDAPDQGRDREDIIWALRDVSFQVEHGEIVGIIGANGAGKTTLLKLLARITPPTSGRALIRGRLSSLLEVGTGFHPELTGRENVYLNGTILGMRKKEVDRKFDEIVAFSEVEQFLDTPVKRYSVGMRVRLAFSVAAHLEPEILIIDEVLAVGDAEFQQKCLNKMDDAGRSGRTVLFVSHNMAAVTRLCPRAILIRNGTVVEDGSAASVVSHYLRAGFGTSAKRAWPDPKSAPGDTRVRLVSVEAVNGQGASEEAMDIREPIGLRMTFDVLEQGHVLYPCFTLTDEQGTRVFTSMDGDLEAYRQGRTAGRYAITAWIPGNLLAEGVYYVGASMRTQVRRDRPFVEQDVVAFNVVDTMEGDSARAAWTGKLPGVIRPRLDWKTEHVPLEAGARRREIG